MMGWIRPLVIGVNSNGRSLKMLCGNIYEIYTEQWEKLFNISYNIDIYKGNYVISVSRSM